MNAPLPLGPGQLALAASLLLLNGVLSVWLGLRLERTLLVAALRSTVQLTLLGYVLRWVFAVDSPWLVLALCALMVTLAGREAVARTSRRVRGMVWPAILAMAVAGGGTALLASMLVIQVEPWWAPRYLVPLVGMILGNALTGVSLGVDRALTLVEEQQHALEALLALGASRLETARPVAAEALRTGMLPILNAMSAVGLVTIPGMMTGQILGGTEPALAARYQLMILFLIAGAVALGTTIAVFAVLAWLIDDDPKLRPDRIMPGLRR
ncbi:MAG: iron export ABC transporter permease subunit FetB, partial [Myxococcota bacterium]